MSKEQADAVALWVAHAHVFEAFDTSPLLAISSAEMRSGKSTLMRLLIGVCPRPWYVVTPSEAVVYRKIQRDRPTLLLDEYDAIFKKREHEPLRALLNAGNEPGAVVPRVGGAQRDRLEDFSVFCPKALAGIGKLPSTLADRSIEIALKRKTPSEVTSRARRRIVAEAAAPLRERLEQWADSAVPALVDSNPELPPELDDRAADSWEPLLAIADLARGDWPERGRTAALTISAGEAREEESFRVALLGAVRRAFASRTADRLSTADLLFELSKDDEAPAEDWWNDKDSKPGKGAAQKLARLFRTYDVRPRTIRLPYDDTAKGYLLEQFEDAFARYLPSQPSHPSHAAPEAAGAGRGAAVTLEALPVTASHAVTPQPARDAGCDGVTGVTDRNGGPSDEEVAAVLARYPEYDRPDWPQDELRSFVANVIAADAAFSNRE